MQCGVGGVVYVWYMCVSRVCRGRSAVCVRRVVSCAVVAVAHGMWLMLAAYGHQVVAWVRTVQRQWRVR